MNRRSTTPAVCPVCGASLPLHARACPDCGADERTGWNEDEAPYDGLDLPETDLEIPPASRRPPLHPSSLARVLRPALALLLVVLLIYGLLRGF